MLEMMKLEIMTLEASSREAKQNAHPSLFPDKLPRLRLQHFKLSLLLAGIITIGRDRDYHNSDL